MTQQPQAKYRHDYRAPDYQITDIDLTFDLDAKRRSLPRSARLSVMVHQMLRFVSTAKTSNWILFIFNNKPWTAWKEEEGALVISNLPERFTLTH
ncbi:hypothetical protein ACNKHM_01795 [Shigella sonnei]